MVVFVESAGKDFIKRMTVFEHKNNSFKKKFFWRTVQDSLPSVMCSDETLVKNWLNDKQ